MRAKIDKSLLAIPEPRRRRSKAHLRFVATMPCVICSKQPCQAAHIRYGYAGAMGLKPGDNLVVPLCPDHHRQQHASDLGERGWWAHQHIDPIKEAEKLWARSPYN